MDLEVVSANILSKRTIIALWHSASRGKTQTLRALADQLVAEFRSRFPNLPAPRFEPPDEGDIRLIIRFGRVIVAVDSAGDPGGDLEGRLRRLITEDNAVLIFCATRTKGETPGAVDRVASENSYAVIWTSTYQAAENHAQINWIKAQHLLSLVKDLGLLS